MSSSQVKEAGELAGRVLTEVEKAVVGKSNALRLVLAGILAKGHVLLEDYPGLGKTLAARSFAQALGLDFARAQFTPDLLPADLTGSFVYDQRQGEFQFRRGPLFTGLLLADEINRTPPKTQAALLEAMQERQITVEGETFVAARAVPRARHREPDRVRRHLPAPGGAARPVPAAGRLRLPHRRAGARRGHATAWRAAARRSSSTRSPTRPGCWRMQAAVETVRRRRERRAATASPGRGDPLPPRGAHRLVAARVARAGAHGAGVRGAPRPRLRRPRGRQGGGPPVLAHRITVKPELWMTEASGLRVVDAVLGSVPTPGHPRGVPCPLSRAERRRASGTGGPRPRWAAACWWPAPASRWPSCSATRCWSSSPRRWPSAPRWGWSACRAASPTASLSLDHLTLHEGQGTRSRLHLPTRRRGRAGHPGQRPGAVRRPAPDQRADRRGSGPGRRRADPGGEPPPLGAAHGRPTSSSR